MKCANLDVCDQRLSRERPAALGFSFEIEARTRQHGVAENLSPVSEVVCS